MTGLFSLAVHDALQALIGPIGRRPRHYFFESGHHNDTAGDSEYLVAGLRTACNLECSHCPQIYSVIRLSISNITGQSADA